jgi:hypothetical protein
VAFVKKCQEGYAWREFGLETIGDFVGAGAAISAVAGRFERGKLDGQVWRIDWDSRKLEKYLDPLAASQQSSLNLQQLSSLHRPPKGLRNLPTSPQDFHTSPSLSLPNRSHLTSKPEHVKLRFRKFSRFSHVRRKIINLIDFYDRYSISYATLFQEQAKNATKAITSSTEKLSGEEMRDNRKK